MNVPEMSLTAPEQDEAWSDEYYRLERLDEIFIELECGDISDEERQELEAEQEELSSIRYYREYE